MKIQTFAVSVVLVMNSCSPRSTVITTPKTFDGSSEQLQSTQIVPTLSQRVDNEKNAIWCAAFQAAWKAMQRELRDAVEWQSETAKLLSLSQDPAANIPDNCLYVAAGWTQLGVVERVQREMREQFPGKRPPEFAAVPANSFLAYAYLEADTPFPRPYTQNLSPLTFTSGSGRTAQVKSFGILSEDSQEEHLRAQALILFRKGEEHSGNFEFAIDLCASSSPSQVVVARISPEPTLLAAFERVQTETLVFAERVKKAGPPDAQKIRVGDTLIVPELHWFISHNFSDLEGLKLGMGTVALAKQEISFSLNRTGMHIEAEAEFGVTSIPIEYTFDGPFLVYVKKRGASEPYFAMWVHNAELLSPWAK